MSSQDMRCRRGVDDQAESVRQEATGATSETEKSTPAQPPPPLSPPSQTKAAPNSDAGVAACGGLAGDGIGDDSFERVVMDKAKDVFVLFYAPSAEFCATNATVFGEFAGLTADRSGAPAHVVAVHMNVKEHKSPFVFEDDELPVIMLFPASDKRPLEFDSELTTAELQRFARENGSAPAAADEPKSEL